MTTKKLSERALAKPVESIVIPAPNLITETFRIRGVSPYVQHRFSQKAQQQILDAQISGAKGKNKKNKKARNVEEDFEGAMYRMVDGSYGIPAPSFRSAMISACRVAGYVMSKAKLTVFIEPDGFDANDGTPLVKLHGEPEEHRAAVRLASGVASIAIRPMWREWHADVRVRWDEDQFGYADVFNLLMRAGMQVGVGEGRPDSKKSHGMGWGLFEIQQGKDQ